MLKAEIKPNGDKTSIQIEMSGDMRRICSDISALIHATYEKMNEIDTEMRYEFKILFTKGFMDGICFADDREHMEHYLAEGDKTYTKSNDKTNAIDKLLDELLDFLKGKNAVLEKILEDDEDDEAE